MSHDLAARVDTDDPPPAPQSFLHANRVSLAALALAVGLAVAVYAAVPNRHGLESLWTLLFHLTPFAAGTVAIAWLDLGWAHRLRLQLILPPICFLGFFCYFVSHNFFYSARDDFDRLYYNQLMMVPYIILTIALCIRLGGGRTSTVVRLAAALLLLQLSGIEDLSYRLIVYIREGVPIPEVWDWADHIAVRLGTHPTKYQAYAFIAVHVVAAILVLALPDRLFRAVGDRLRRRSAVEAVD